MLQIQQSSSWSAGDDMFEGAHELQLGRCAVMKRLAVVCLAAYAFCAGTVDGGVILTGSLSTPADEGLVGGGATWSEAAGGVTVSWVISQNADFTWHYKYSFTDTDGDPLGMLVSHFIISVSDDLTAEDVFNFGMDVADFSVDTFGPAPGNPGFPEGQTIWGLKIDMGGEQLVAEFDSYRAPMWGDFYAKDGGNPQNYAYNTDFGVEVVNQHDYEGVPVDAYANPLFKALVPNTVPEPATFMIVGIGALLLTKRRA